VWFCFAFPLLIKLMTAAVVNVSHPRSNAVMMVFIYLLDALLGFWYQGHRDRVINVTTVITGTYLS